MYSGERFLGRYNLESTINDDYVLSSSPLAIDYIPFLQGYYDAWAKIKKASDITTIVPKVHTVFEKNTKPLRVNDPSFKPDNAILDGVIVDEATLNASILDVYNNLLFVRNLFGFKRKGTLPYASGIDVLLPDPWATKHLFHFQDMNRLLKFLKTNEFDLRRGHGLISILPGADSPAKFEETGTCLFHQHKGSLHLDVRTLVLSNKGSGKLEIGAQKLTANPKVFR